MAYGRSDSEIQHLASKNFICNTMPSQCLCLFLWLLAAAVVVEQARAQCGCGDCTAAILSADAGGQTCQARLQTYRDDNNVDPLFPDPIVVTQACASVATTYPTTVRNMCTHRASPLDECLLTAPKLTNYMADPSAARNATPRSVKAKRRPTAPAKSVVIRFGIPTPMDLRVDSVYSLPWAACPPPTVAALARPIRSNATSI
jgi:hypothetical protein